MTEAEWLACEDPSRILGILNGEVRDRKLSLFAVGCCRRIWGYLDDERGRPALEAAEQWADGGLSTDELTSWAQACYLHDPAFVERTGISREVAFAASTAVARAMNVKGYTGAKSAALHVAHIAGAISLGPMADSFLLYQMGKDVQLEEDDLETAERAIAVEKTAQVAIIHDIFGNPFRPVAFDPSWRSETAASLAAGIYELRAFDRLPILADALEEAGCDQPDVLNHLRGPGPHARGCWVVDSVLGKE